MGSFPETCNDRFQWNSEVWSLEIQTKHLEVKILDPTRLCLSENSGRVHLSYVRKFFPKHHL